MNKPETDWVGVLIVGGVIWLMTFALHLILF